MDRPQHEFRRRLIKGVSVLSKLIRSLDLGSEQGYEVTRKLAASVLRSSETHGYPQLIAAAAPFAAAPAEALPMLARRLLRVIESVASNGWDTRQRILLVDQDPDLAQRLTAKLRAPTREVLHVSSAAGARETIDGLEIALVVLDLTLPDADGRDLISALRADPRTSVIPIVILSDWGSDDVRAECFALGADQFFEKSGDLDLLAVSVASTLHRSVAHTRDTHHDAITHLLSREGLRDKFGRSLKRAKSKGQSVSLVLLELDLSSSRDGASEEFVFAFARGVRGVLRPTDRLARWSEGELIMLLSDTDANGAARVVERIQEALEERPFLLGKASIRLVFSHGIAQVTGESALEDAVAEADRALFASRLSPRAQLPGDSRPKILIADADTESVFAVRRAFEKDHFEVLHLRTGRQTLRVASAGRIQLILVDSRLEDMKGIELVERLRQQPRLLETPVVMTSATGRDLELTRAFEKGVDDYVLKPCASNVLIARMRRLLKRASPSSGPFKVMRRTGAMAGLFAGDQLFELVQMVGLNHKTGRLVVSSETFSGHVDFLEGLVTKAWTSRGREGAEACEQLLGLANGRFEFWPGSEAVSTSGELLRLSVDSLLLDAMRRRDEGI